MNDRTLPKGIYRRGSKFIAQARVNKKQIQLGTFTTLEEAVAALDKGIERALQGVETVIKREKYVKQIKTYNVPIQPHEDDSAIVDRFHIYIIVKGNTQYAQWQRNTALPPTITLEVAKKFLAKRDVRVISLDDFNKLYQAKLEVLVEPWLKTYRILGQGSRKNTLHIVCKGCATPSLIRIGDPYVKCGCSSEETILYFGKNIDGTFSVSVGPTKPANVIGCLVVPTGGVINLPIGAELEHMLEPVPSIELEQVLDKPYVDKRKAILEEPEPEEDDLEAYTQLLEEKLIDLDNEFELDIPEAAKAVSNKLLEEDRASKREGASSDLTTKGKK